MVLVIFVVVAVNGVAHSSGPIVKIWIFSGKPAILSSRCPRGTVAEAPGIHFYPPTIEVTTHFVSKIYFRVNEPHDQKQLIYELCTKLIRVGTIIISCHDREKHLDMRYIKNPSEGGSPGIVVMVGSGSWVRIPTLYTGWTFFTFICC